VRSDSFERGGQPRSVPDHDREGYARMIRRHQAVTARSGGGPGDQLSTEQLLGDRMFGVAAERNPRMPDVGHPGPWESVIPIWGSGREALAEEHDGNHLSAIFNGGLAASDAFVLKALASGLVKGGLKVGGTHVWRNAPKEAESARQWLGRKGFLKRNQPGHHWWLEQKSAAPDWLKNQPPFVNGMADHVQHGRIHGPYTVDGVKLPRFNRLQRFWYGTPHWFKALTVSTSGHADTAAGRAAKSHRPQR
jgi:hypothetical protein